MTYEHLSSRTQVVAGQGIPERIEYLRQPPLLHIQSLEQVETWLREAIFGYVERPFKPVTFLLAPSGMGSSRMIRRVVEAFPPNNEKDQRIAHHPAVLAHIPATGRLREIGAEVCSIVGAPAHYIRGPAPGATHWLKLLNQIGTRILFLDDIQALSCLSKSHQAPVLNMIRHATSRYGLQLVLVGPPDLRPVIMNDAQLADRTQLVEIQPFMASDPALTDFLEAFLDWCPLQRTSDLCDDLSLRRTLVRRTGGTTRNLLDVLTRLAAFAIYSAEERITYNLWREYFAQAEYD